MICVVFNGKIRITQTCHQTCEEYQLRRLHRFIQDPNNINELKEGLENLELVDGETAAEENSRIAGRLYMDENRELLELWRIFINNPCSDTLQPVLLMEGSMSLSSQTGASILYMIALSATTRKTVRVEVWGKGQDLPSPILVVNLDKERLEIYYGYTMKHKDHIFKEYTTGKLVPCNIRGFSFSKLGRMNYRELYELSGLDRNYISD